MTQRVKLGNRRLFWLNPNQNLHRPTYDSPGGSTYQSMTLPFTEYFGHSRFYSTVARRRKFKFKLTPLFPFLTFILFSSPFLLLLSPFSPTPSVSIPPLPLCTSPHSSRRSTSGSFPPSNLSKDRSPNEFFMHFKVENTYFVFHFYGTKMHYSQKARKAEIQTIHFSVQCHNFCSRKKFLTDMLNDGLTLNPPISVKVKSEKLCDRTYRRSSEF